MFKIVLVKNKANLWQFPGGKVNKAEEFCDCAIREV